MKITRFTLLSRGLFPETLPPCFISKDSKRAFHGLVGNLEKEKFYKKHTRYIRYSGTKHDGSRRFFGTPNIVNYFHISSFIHKNWLLFENNFKLSKYSIGTPKLLEPQKERAIKVPSLSELSKYTSKNLRYAPYILKADISQCFPSLYTHSIPWAVHGIEASKSDTKVDSKSNIFNSLDFFVRNGQFGNTRGVLVGPDAYRLIAELVLARIDKELQNTVGNLIVGAVRHVDDYYFGLKNEYDAQAVLSSLREVLATYELYLNDHKTKILSSLEPINDLWAQRLKDHTTRIDGEFPLLIGYKELERAINEATNTAKEIKSASPIKILLRSFDDQKVYNSLHWDYIEQNLLRIIQKYPHALDYACLLVAKRYAITKEINKEDWKDVSEIIIKRCLLLNHHHEVVWMLWLMIVTEIDIEKTMIEKLSKTRNSHIQSMLIQGFSDKRIKHKPQISLGTKLETTDEMWLVNLVARSSEYTKAKFSGGYSKEFKHLAKRKIKLIDFKDHLTKIKKSSENAISRERYGYDDDDDDEYDQNYIIDEDNDIDLEKFVNDI